MKKRISAVTLALGLLILPAGAASAASTNPCMGGDDLEAVTVSTAAYDTNANGYVCAHTEHYHAPKKPGPPSPSKTYYDDRI